jgi:hypothetical protein
VLVRGSNLQRQQEQKVRLPLQNDSDARRLVIGAPQLAHFGPSGYNFPKTRSADDFSLQTVSKKHWIYDEPCVIELSVFMALSIFPHPK